MNNTTMPPGAVQFRVTHNWSGQLLPESLLLWVSPRFTPLSKKNLKPDCPCTQFYQLVVEHPTLPGQYGCVCECVGKAVS